MHQLSRQDARRIAVRAQRLDAERPFDLQEAIGDLTLVQVDPISRIAPSADLVLWSRLGSGYDKADLAEALQARTVVEIESTLHPADDVALHRAEMAAWPGPGPLSEWEEAIRDWVSVNDACRRDILDRLERSGPITSREIPDTCVRPWRSSGWTDDKNVTRLLGLMTRRGEVAVSGRKGRDRLWDLAERVYPDEPVPSYDDARLQRQQRSLESLGLARPTGPRVPAAVYTPDVGEPAVVEGVAGEWRVDPAQVEALEQPFEGRAALLSPLDRLIHDRVRMGELFEFDYVLEMYKPVAQRRWGYYALPVLHDDRLVGKLDATADRKAGLLRVHAIHEDEPWPVATTEAVHAEIDDLARWLGLEVDHE